jgi:hypothetical protein
MMFNRFGGLQGPRGARGPQGEPGAFPLTLPTLSEGGRVPYTRVSEGLTVFDYIANDDVSFGDQGVPVGRYLAAASNNMRSAIIAALAANPTKVLFIIPPGDWVISAAITEAHGLRDNLVFDGVDKYRCRLYRNGSGNMFLFTSDGHANIVFRNMTLDMIDPLTSFGQLINISQATNVLVDNCRFLCSIPVDQTSDGGRSGAAILGGNNLVVRHSFFQKSQLALCGLGRSARNAVAVDNRFEDCNDVAISVVADLTANSLRDITVSRNHIRGMFGAGVIYVGSDAPTEHPTLLADVSIEENVFSGTQSNQFTVLGRNLLAVAFCINNKRIKVRGNIMSGDTSSTAPLYGVRVFDRLLSDAGEMTSCEGIDVSGNDITLNSADAQGGVEVVGKGLSDVHIKDNTVAAGSRGIITDGCSFTQISGNIVRGAITNPLNVRSSRATTDEVEIRNNHLHTAVAFKSAVFHTGAHNQTNVTIESNRLRSSHASVQHSMTGGATVTFDHLNNRQSSALDASAVPVANTGNLTRA